MVVALRADFYGRCAAYPELARLLAANHVLVGAMRHVELRSAIVDPAERAGLVVEPELADALVADVEHQPGALPLLSTALLELWQRRDGTRLRLATYEETGGVLGAVARLAEDAFGRLDPAQQGVARTVLLRLAEVEPEGGVERRRLPLAELEATGDGAAAGVIEQLADARLLTVSAGSVEFAHEALLREWPRLRDWIEEDRDDLRLHRSLSLAEQEWTRLDRDDSALYHGARLAEAQAWAERGDPGPTEPERAFLAASTERERRERRSHRRRLAIAVGGADDRRGRDRGDRARGALTSGATRYDSATSPTSRELAARSSSFLDVDPGLSLTLALQALERRDTEQAQNVLRQATLASRALAVWHAHDDWVHAVEPSADGRQLVTAGRDGAVRIWDTDSGRGAWSVDAHRGWALGAALSPDGRQVASTGDDGVVAVWDVATREKRTLARLAPAYATGVQFSPDGTKLIVSAVDGTVRVLPVSGEGPATVLRGHAGPVWSARFDPDGRRAVSAGLDRTVRIWNLSAGTATVVRSPAALTGVDFSPDGRHVAAAGEDGVVRVWPADGQGRPLRIRTDEQQVNAVRFSPDSKRLVTAGDDGVVRVWSAEGGPELAELRGHRGTVLAAAFVPGTDTVASGGEDGTVRRWALPDTQIVEAPVTGASFAPDGRRVVAGGADGAVRIWDPSSGAVTTLRGHREPSFAQPSADGKRVVSASQDGTVRIWDMGTGSSEVVHSEQRPLFVARFDPSGERIAFAGGTRRIVVQRSEGGDQVVMRGHGGVVRDVAFSPDGARLASASDDGTVRIWSVSTGKLERTLRGHAQSVVSVAFSPDGRRVASSGADGTIRVWPTDSGSPVILRGHEGLVASVAFDPTGRLLTSAGQDGTVRVWNASGGEALVTLYRHQGSAYAAQFSPDGRRVVSAGDPGTIRVSPCEVCGSIDAVLETARTRAKRQLTAAERQRLLPGDK